MKFVRLLQIGDIHFPSSKTSMKVDLKDRSFPGHIVEIAVADAMHNSFKEMLTLLAERNKKIDGILICGDLTDYGDIFGYRECLKYLHTALRLKDTTVWDKNNLHVVPGNHDIDRNAVDAAGEDLDKKFEPLLREWKAFGLEILDPQKGRATDIISADGSRARVISLNSCLGCGERKLLPEKIRDELWAIIDGLSKGTDKKMFPLPQEVLDTPAFREDDITTACEEILTLDAKAITIILAHHNLLPQATPRFSIYTEVVNAGLVRSRFSDLKRPLIYCHGHIHDDPLEVVYSPSSFSFGVICISAPAVVDGFNVLELQFSRHGYPLGCVVRPFRMHRDGGVKELSGTRIPLQLKHHSKVTDINDRAVLNVLQKKAQPFVFQRFDTLYEKISTGVRRALRHNIRQTTFADMLLEAEWLGFVEILDRQETPKHWQIQRIIP